MSRPGDYGPEMSALRLLDDEAIEAITAGDPVAPELLALASFAEHVRSAGDRPAPSPSLELQALITAHARAVSQADRARRVIPPSLVGSPARVTHRRLTSIGSRVAGLGIAAKVALGVSVATAGVAGAGAAGALPGHADEVVRDAIEAVTPLDLPNGVPPAGDQGPGGPSPAPAPAATGTDAPPSSAAGGGPSAGERPPAGDDQGGNGAPEGGDGPGGGNDAAGGDRVDRGDGPAADGSDVGSPGGDRAPGGYGDDDLDRDGDDRTRFRGERWYDPAGPGQDTPAPAPGDSPDAAGDEGTDPGVARDADAAGSTG